MNELYDINKGLSLLKNRKTADALTYVALGICAAITAVTVVFGFAIWMAVLFAVFWAAFAFWSLTYGLYIRKKWNAHYHFLAKVEQFEHKVFQGELVAKSDCPITNENMSMIEVRLDRDVLFVEADKAPLFELGKNYRVEAVDGVIVGYEEI